MLRKILKSPIKDQPIENFFQRLAAKSSRGVAKSISRPREEGKLLVLQCRSKSVAEVLAEIECMYTYVQKHTPAQLEFLLVEPRGPRFVISIGFPLLSAPVIMAETPN